MKKGTAIAAGIAAFIVAALIIVAVILVPSIVGSDAPQTDAGNIDVTLNANNVAQGGGHSSTSTTEIDGGSDANESDGNAMDVVSPVANENTDTDDFSDTGTDVPKQTTDDGKQEDNQAADDGSWDPNWSANKMLNDIDVEKTESTARQFIEAYLNYDSESLADGSWRRGVSNFIDASKLNDASDEYAMRVGEKEWAANTGTYDGVVSRIESIDNVSAYASNITTGENAIDVSVKVTFVASGLPGDSAFYKQQNRYQATFLVQFDDTGTIVTDCSQASTKVLDENINGVDDVAGGIM